jgi:hypothetical protein
LALLRSLSVIYEPTVQNEEGPKTQCHHAHQSGEKGTERRHFLTDVPSLHPQT